MLEAPSIFFQLRGLCQCLTYPSPVPKGQYQRNQSGLQFSEDSQVIGGETSNIISCTNLTRQATAKKKKKDKERW